MAADGAMFQQLPWPFEKDQFPPDLGVVVMRTVSSGAEPARLVQHTRDNSWAIGDGVGDPNLPGACEVTHMRHVVERNSSVASLATLPPGYVAERQDSGTPWVISPVEDSD